MRGTTKLRPGVLASLRRKSDMTQAKLAEATGLSHGIIGFYEAGQRNPSTAALDKIAAALDVLPEDLTEVEA